MKRTAAKVVASKRIELLEEEIPTLGADDALIEIAACGICQTEIDVFDGLVQGTPGASFRYRAFPSDLGHEVSGVIADVGRDVTDLKVGQRVTGIVYSGCGFATHIVEKARMLVPISESLKLEHALGEPVMCITNIVRLSEVDVGDTVVVIGSGYIALLTIAMLAHYPVKDIIVCGGFDDRLAMARRFGATVTVNTRRENAWERITDHTAKVGADVVIELTGRMDMLRLGASITKAKSRSRLVMAGVYGDEPFALGNYLQNRAPRLIAAYPNQSPNMMDDLRRGLWALEHGWLPQAELVTHRFSLADSQKGMELARTKAGGYIKGVIIPHAPLT